MNREGRKENWKSRHRQVYKEVEWSVNVISNNHTHLESPQDIHNSKIHIMSQQFSIASLVLGVAILFLFVGDLPVACESKEMVERLKVPPRFGKRLANNFQGNQEIQFFPKFIKFPFIESMVDTNKFFGYDTNDIERLKSSSEVNFMNAGQMCRSMQLYYQKVCSSQSA